LLNEELLMTFDIDDEHLLDDMQMVESLSQRCSKTGLEKQSFCQEPSRRTSTCQNCLDPEQMNVSSDSEDLKRSARITELREVHFILCDASQLTNSIFQVQILVGFIEIFVEVTLCLYASLTYVTGLFTCKLYSPTKWSVLGMFLMWTTIHLSKLIAVTTSCHGASEQANRAAVLVQKLLVVQSLCPETTYELRLFSQQLLQRKARFSACGFFPIDFTLLYSMAGSVTTYLIILLQYTGEDMSSLREVCNKTFNKPV
jgi:gustatory receptor